MILVSLTILANLKILVNLEIPVVFGDFCDSGESAYSVELGNSCEFGYFKKCQVIFRNKLH